MYCNAIMLGRTMDNKPFQKCTNLLVLDKHRSDLRSVNTNMSGMYPTSLLEAVMAITTSG